MNHGISFMLGFVCALIGVGMGSGAAYWVDGPDSNHPDYERAVHYTEPVCPDGFEASFFGVTLASGVSRPIYQCLAPGYGGSKDVVRWEDSEAKAQAQSNP